MAILEVSELKKSFGRNEVLKGISFSLEEGEVLSVIGSSGGGKTTLLRCLNSLEFADSGTISVAGKNMFDGADKKKISDSTLRRRRLHFGLVFQQFNLFPQYTVLENVTLAPRLLASEQEDYSKNKKAINAEIESNALSLINRVGLGDKINNYPCELSGGQQQRVAIARALALKPEILCFDEPTSALDPELTGEVLSVIRDLKQTNMTMLIVTHEMKFARDVSDKVIFMCDGRIEEMGTPSQVFDTPVSEKTRAFISK